MATPSRPCTKRSICYSPWFRLTETSRAAIVSERDIVRSLAANGARTLEMTAGQLMTRALQFAHPETTVAEAMGKMTVCRFRHMPVMDREALVGLISIGDVVKARIMEQEDEVDSLKAYVAGSA